MSITLPLKAEEENGLATATGVEKRFENLKFK
jgi:hypothetical protein